MIIYRTNLQQDIEAVITLLDQNEARIIVAGLPLTKDGIIGHQAEKVKAFTDALAKNTKTPIVHRDESLTTLEARSVIQLTRKKKRINQKDDAIAAAFILQRYLDEQQNTTESK